MYALLGSKYLPFLMYSNTENTSWIIKLVKKKKSTFHNTPQETILGRRTVNRGLRLIMVSTWSCRDYNLWILHILNCAPRNSGSVLIMIRGKMI